MADTVEADPAEPEFLLPCAVCGRTFRPESLQKHSRVCQRNATKKRKTFDSSKQRIQGTELADFLSTSTLLQSKKAEKCRSAEKNKSHWKQKHMEFMHAIRAARGVEKTLSPRSSAALTRPPESRNCPHCDRQFGPKAIDRHIEWCREQKARIPKSPASVKAKERLEARIRYRAPVIRRISIREKYSPQLQRKTSEASVYSSADVMKPKEENINRVSHSSACQVSTSHPRTSMSSSNTHSGRSIMNNRKESTNSKKGSNITITSPKKHSNSSMKRDVSERKQVTPQTANKKVDKITSSNLRESVRNRRSHMTDTKVGDNSKPQQTPNLSEKPGAHKSSEEVYNPFVSAERQMMELLSDDHPVTSKVPSRGEVHSAPAYQKDQPSLSSTNNDRAELHSAPPVSHPAVESNIFPYTNVNNSSETSFHNSSTEELNSPSNSVTATEYTHDPLDTSHIWSGSLQELDDMLNDGFLPYEIAESLYGGSDERGSSLSLCSLQFLENMSCHDNGSSRKISKIRAKMENASLQLKKSVALHDSSVDLSEEQNDEFTLISDNNELPCDSSPTSFFLSSPDSSQTPRAENNDSRKLCDLLSCKRDVVNSEKANNSAITNPNSDTCYKENLRNHTYSSAGKNSADSAYSSLNRQSPKYDVQDPGQAIPISSSGSESSLPTVCHTEVIDSETATVRREIQKDGNGQEKDIVMSNLPKFCHECGSQYPVNLAKFCCECGVRRLLI